MRHGDMMASVHMRLPLLLRRAKSVPLDAPPVPGRYDRDLALRVYDAPTGPTPVIDGAELPAQLTKTEARREVDDDAVALASITKSADPRENQDPDIHMVDREAPVRDRVIELLTKTLRAREADDA